MNACTCPNVIATAGNLLQVHSSVMKRTQSTTDGRSHVVFFIPVKPNIISLSLTNQNKTTTIQTPTNKKEQKNCKTKTKTKNQNNKNQNNFFFFFLFHAFNFTGCNSCLSLLL